METAYVLMLVVFVIAIFFGRANVSPRVTGAIAVLVLTSVTLAKVLAGERSTDRLWDALLFISPFLVAAAILYFAIGYLGAALGRASPRKSATASEPTANPVASSKKTLILGVMLLIALPVFIGTTTSLVAVIGNWWERIFR